MVDFVGPKHLLFVGDSLTYCNDLDQMVKLLAEAAFPETSFVVHRSVVGGAPLKTLWKESDAQQRIATGKYDVVVLQEDLPETTISNFHKHTEKFVSACREAGSSTLLLMAWPYQRLGWIDTAGIAEAHRSIGNRLGVPIAPAGIAWEKARAARPGVPLYAKDKEHPSLIGSYLTAAVLFASIWQHTPEGLITDAGGPALRAKGLAPFLQHTAWQVAQAETSFTRHLARSADACTDRVGIVETLFKLLDVNQDALLCASELRRFEDFVGFRGDEASWAIEFACMCAELGVDIDHGISEESFRQLVDVGVPTCLYSTDCTTAELIECLARLRA